MPTAKKFLIQKQNFTTQATICSSGMKKHDETILLP